MTSKQPTEPGWDANGSPVSEYTGYVMDEGGLYRMVDGVKVERLAPHWEPVVDTADYRAEYGELCEWAANERRLQLMLAKPVPYLPGDKL